MRGGREWLLPSGSLPQGIAISRPLLLTPGDGMLQQLWCLNFSSLLLTAQTSEPAKREIASCKGKEKINMVYALGQLCQCSVLCAQPLQEHSPKAHSLYNLTAGFPFSSSIQNLLGTAKVLGIPVRLFQSPFDLVHSGIVAQ